MNKVIFVRNHAYATARFNELLKQDRECCPVGVVIKRASIARYKIEFNNGDSLQFVPLSISWSEERIRGLCYDSVDYNDIKKAFSEILQILKLAKKEKT